MDDMQKTREYYQLVVEKFEKTVQWTPNQLEVQRELLQLVTECSSNEEVQVRMKNEGYYEKPAQALFLDKMLVLKKATEENGLPELAQIYQKKYNEVKKDAKEMHTTGHIAKIQEFERVLSEKLSAFNKIFAYYLEYMMPVSLDDIESVFTGVKETNNILLNLGTNFDELATDTYFRKHIFLDDTHYEIFVADIKSLLSQNAPKIDTAYEEETSAAWSVLKNKEKELKEIAQHVVSKMQSSVAMVVAPEDKNGKYKFILNKKEKF